MVQNTSRGAVPWNDVENSKLEEETTISVKPTRRANLVMVFTALGFFSQQPRLRSNIEEQRQLAESLERQLQEKLTSQSGEVKVLSEEAAALRNELKTVAEETQVP